MCRIIQYFLKFFIPVLQSQGPRFVELTDRLSKLAANMSITRKVLRFGKPLPLIKAIIDRIREHQRKGVKMVFWRTISDLCLIIYFLTDHPLYFQRVGLAKMDKPLLNSIDWWNNFFWLMNALLDMMCDIVELYHLQKEIV